MSQAVGWHQSVERLIWLVEKVTEKVGNLMLLENYIVHKAQIRPVDAIV